MNLNALVRTSLLAVASSFIVSVGSLAHAATPIGPEFRVNQTVTGDQRYAAVAASANGAFIVVWESEVVGRSVTDIFARRYDPYGQPLGDEFRVNTTTANRQVFPAVAMNDSGAFVIAWDSLGQDGAGLSLYAQRYSADGTAQAGEFRVNDGQRDIFSRVGVAMDSAGDFVIVWPERKTPLPVATTVRLASINVRPYGPDGVARSDQFEVGTSIQTNLRIPAVGMSTGGNFVVAWQSDPTQVLPVQGTGSNGAGIYARRYSLAGKALAAAVQVDDSSTGILKLPKLLGTPAQLSDRPAIAVGTAGDFVVSWQRNLADFTPVGTFGRRYDVNGAALGPEFRVGPVTQLLRFPGIAVDLQGRTTIVAHDASGVYAQRYAADGSLLGAQLELDDGAGSGALLPAVATDAAGNFITVWQDFGRDGDGRGIVARRYAP